MVIPKPKQILKINDRTSIEVNTLDSLVAANTPENV
jgi:hypothetical protein